MKNHLKQLCGNHTYKDECCPHDYDSVPNITGCFELDAVIAKSENKDMLSRLSCHIKGDAYNSTKMDK